MSARSQAPHRTRTGISAGVFAGWSWDGRALEVEHDRYGFYLLFYYSPGTQTYVELSRDAVRRRLPSGPSPCH